MFNRRDFIRAAGLAGAAMATPRFVFAREQSGKSVLKFTPSSALTILDPVTSIAAVTITHGYCVFDTLYGLDSKFVPQPQMAEDCVASPDGTSWTLRLRKGLFFHDGQPVRSRDCAASLRRWGKRDTSGRQLAEAVQTYETPDDLTLVFKLKKPFPRLLHMLAKPHSSPAFIMPERLANTSPTTALTEMVGSGPFKFIAAEYVPGSKVVYEKFDKYTPRGEPADWTSGGKNVFFDRLEWHVIPDAATAAAALQNGEIDWWEVPLPDLLPVLEASPGVKVRTGDPSGLIAILKFNCVQPPFDNPKLRLAVYEAVKQTDYMEALGLSSEDYKACLSNYPCGQPGVTEGLIPKPAGLSKARQMIKDAGYRGEKVVIINPTDNVALYPLGHVTADLLTKIGFNVDLQDMDWGTLLQRRTSQASVQQGGWSIFHTNWPSVAVADPSSNTPVRGQGATGYFGWFDDPETERLASDWLRESNPQKQQALFEQAQERALEMMPMVMLGEFTLKTALRKNLVNDVPGNCSFFWNIRRA